MQASLSSNASSSSCESNGSYSLGSLSSSDTGSSALSRGIQSRKASSSSSQSSHCHTDRALEQMLTLDKSPLMQLSSSSADQVWRSISRKKGSARSPSHYSCPRSRPMAAKTMTRNTWHTSPRLSLKMGLIIPSTLSLSSAEMHHRMDSIEFPRIKVVTATQPYIVEGEYHQYHHAMTTSECDAYMSDHRLDEDRLEEQVTNLHFLY